MRTPDPGDCLISNRDQEINVGEKVTSFKKENNPQKTGMLNTEKK
jgi:hypothetical protein